jgi:hypothetical protein
MLFIRRSLASLQYRRRIMSDVNNGRPCFTSPEAAEGAEHRVVQQHLEIAV